LDGDRYADLVTTTPGGGAVVAFYGKNQPRDGSGGVTLDDLGDAMNGVYIG
jgi:hypothetical protein